MAQRADPYRQRRLVRWTATGLLALCGLACADATELPPRTLDVAHADIAIECDGRATEPAPLRDGRLEHVGLRVAPGVTCRFDFEVPPDSTLAFRAKALGRAGSAHVVLSASLGEGERTLFDEPLRTGAAITPRVAVEPGNTRFALHNPIGGVPLDWTELVFTTRTPEVSPPWTVPVEEALASWPGDASIDPKRRRLLTIGIDGGSWSQLGPLVELGELPNLAALRRRGRWGVLESTRVPESAMAWTSMRTGVGPGVHGVFTFYSPEPSRRSYWHLLGDHGLSSILIAVPKTSAGRPLRGVMIAGWPATGDQAYVRPPALQSHLERAGVDPALAYVRNPAVFRARMQKRTEVAIALLERRDWDHAFVVYEYGDTAGHLFRIATPEWAEVQRDIDTLLGSLLAHVSRETTVLVVSDHGWERYPRSVNIGAWLRRNGHENLEAAIPASGRVVSITVADGESTADPTQLAQVREGLLGLQHPAGGRSIDRVDPASNLFPGPMAAPAALVVQAATGHRAFMKNEAKRVFGSRPVDHHGRDGLYLLAGPGITPGPGPRASIYDVAPTVLAHFGVPVPQDLEGATLHDFGVPPRTGVESSLRFDDGPGAESSPNDPTLDERLRALGYIE